MMPEQRSYPRYSLELKQASGWAAKEVSLRNSLRRSPLAFATLSKTTERKGGFMNINTGLTPMISIIAGILILVMPRLLNFIVAIYLIIIGLVGLFGTGNFHLR